MQYVGTEEQRSARASALETRSARADAEVLALRSSPVPRSADGPQWLTFAHTRTFRTPASSSAALPSPRDHTTALSHSLSLSLSRSPHMHTLAIPSGTCNARATGIALFAHSLTFAHPSQPSSPRIPTERAHTGGACLGEESAAPFAGLARAYFARLLLSFHPPAPELAVRRTKRTGARFPCLRSLRPRRSSRPPAVSRRIPLPSRGSPPLPWLAAAVARDDAPLLKLPREAPAHARAAADACLPPASTLGLHPQALH